MFLWLVSKILPLPSYSKQRMKNTKIKQKITTFLWFDKQAKEAAEFYCSLFDNSRIITATPMVVVFELEGQKFMALNGGPQFHFTEAISLYVDCATQDEIDFFWNKLTEEGTPSQCGWLKDKYGLSWQIVPSLLGQLMGSPEKEKAQNVLQAMLGMKKMDIRALQNAYDNKETSTQ
jgi:predicted 3-demethylubiquinone-9 3-methyltransferase (glyoxalase superfamily)